jgi:hypothetical protein
MIGPYFKCEKMQLREISRGGKRDGDTQGSFYFLLMKSSLMPVGIYRWRGGGELSLIERETRNLVNHLPRVYTYSVHTGSAK